MADGTEYISHEGELGSVSISEEVLAVIAAAAAVDVEGVSCLGNGVGRDLTDPASRKALTRGVRLWVENTSGLEVAQVNGSVVGVTFQK